LPRLLSTSLLPVKVIISFFFVCIYFITVTNSFPSLLGPQPEVPGKDPHCDWTFTGCFGKEDLHQCPKGQFSLTYDDGPSEFSPKLYDYLDEVNVKATFFMVGGQVVKFPDHTLRAFKAGHELAMHTWSHNYMTTLTNEQIVAELKWNELAIKEVTGVAPKFFRPPYGDIDNRVRDVARALGFIPVIWTHDTNDWAYANNPKGYPESWVTGNVTKWAHDAPSAAHGGISLEHDLYKETVDVAIKIIPTLKKVYELVPSGQCNGVAPYKGNATVPVPPAASSSALPSASPVAPVKPVAPVAPVAPAADSSAAGKSPIAAGVAGSGAASSFTGASAFGLGVAAVAAVALL
jgi:peptidoglycan/xylan/chitin deacetylase (PgdA/CDA1 family)